MTDASVYRRLTDAADFLDWLYEGTTHVPVDLEHHVEGWDVLAPVGADPEKRPVAQFYYGGIAEVFLTVGPTALPLLAVWLRAEAADVAACDVINSHDPENPGKTRVMYRSQTSAAYVLADHILRGNPAS